MDGEIIPRQAGKPLSLIDTSDLEKYWSETDSVKCKIEDNSESGVVKLLVVDRTKLVKVKTIRANMG